MHREYLSLKKPVAFKAKPFVSLLCCRSRGERQGGQGDVVYPIGYSEKPVPDTSIQETDKNLVEKVHSCWSWWDIDLICANEGCGYLWGFFIDLYFLVVSSQIKQSRMIIIQYDKPNTNMFSQVCLFLASSYSAAGTWLLGPWNRSQWTCLSCICQATPSPSSPSWWSAWWPGGPYRPSCPCLPVSIQHLHVYVNGGWNRTSLFWCQSFLNFNSRIHAFCCASAFKLLESSSQQWLQGFVYLIGNLLGSALAIYKCQSMGLLPTHSSDWLAFIEPPQVKAFVLLAKH